VQRPHSYRVRPELAHSLLRAGINVVTLANNHLLDCGRAGVVETLEALKAAGISPIGGGVTREAAHMPVIRQTGRHRIGLLGYYWNRRCAAMRDLPGSATDTPEALETDIRALRDRVDRVVVTFHWGVPYTREPAPEDRAKAHFAIDCGADLVIGHHQHVVQPFEVYRGRPIFYGVGNFAFGSGNSQAEGLLIGVHFNDRNTRVHVYPLYVKNRDPRVAYQPKVMRGAGADRILLKLAGISGVDGQMLSITGGRGTLNLGNE
jgi:poly-gamma-glutamate capsule biosynthesis protein CapA/YwtB (metallophosphatase superfamily)